MKRVIVAMGDIRKICKEKHIELDELVKIVEFAYSNVTELVTASYEDIALLVDKYRYKPE